jgi:O-Antigen ligase
LRAFPPLPTIARVRRLLAVLLFLTLANDASTLYSAYMFAPLVWVQPLLFDPLPIKIRPFDLIMGALLAYASSKPASRGPRVKQMKSMMFLSIGTVVVWFIFGVVTGGDARAASWQVYLLVVTLVTSFAVANICKTAEHYVPLAKAVIAAGVYRATMGLIFYIFYVRPHKLDTPEYLTTHYDTIVWTLAIIIMVAAALENPARKVRMALGFITPYLLVAIQLNNRRLAWVSLIGALITTFVLLKPSKIKRRINRMFLIAAPVIALYVIVGWGSTAKIFKPLEALATVSTVEDASTKARNVENLGLIATANQYGWIMGSGWGHKYIEISHKYYIGSVFELWQYVPHNSILGLLAYTGYLGFCGYWLMFPTAVFLHARTARLALRPLERAIGIVGVAIVVICANQMYGDMGIFSGTTMYIVAIGFGIALRLPVEAGVWGAAVQPRRAPVAPQPAAAGAPPPHPARG